MLRGSCLASLFLIIVLPSGAGAEGQHWTYDGEHGPEHWGSISPEFEVYEKGNNQSPIDYNDLMPNRREYFLYNGSLITPPCTEGVPWVVLKEPIVASPAQIQQYHDPLGFDRNRPIQPHNSRVVVD